MIKDSGFFYTLPYGYKREKNKGKVQNHPEAREKYGTEQEKMDIRPRKAGKKSKILRKAREKYGTEQVKMDIKPRKAGKKSKILRKPERNTETGVNAIMKMDIREGT